MQYKNHTILFFLGAVVVGAFSGCAKYKVQPLKPLANNSSNNTESSISFACHVFDKQDCKKYLDRNVIAQGYQPIHITLTNNTRHYFNISKAKMSMPCVPALEVARKVHTSTLGRAAGYGIAGLIVWPLIVPAVVDGVGSSQANTKLDLDFSKKELSDQVINPFNTVNGLIFVPIDTFDPKHIEITLVDAESHTSYMLSPRKPFIKI